MAKEIIITPETHWDREWYLPFQSYRLKLVLLIDRLLDLVKQGYENFTLDGQSVVLQDYLEIRPEKEAELKKYITSGNITVGPMYILPDEYLVSGEALIRNLMLGVKIARSFGRSMNAAYIPDPFGHVAQLPQIVSGFDLPIILFARGFGNEFVDQQLNMEFIWDAPGKAADAIGVHLIAGYGSVSELSDRKDKDGKYKDSIERIERVVGLLEKHTMSDTVILNNGSDHLFPQPFVPELVKQWNATHDKKMIQTDFGKYADKIVPFKSKMKHFTGELHGGRYQNVLSGVFSARMWIKQANYAAQNLLERYSEPAAAMNWFLTKGKYPFPTGFLWGAWQYLLRNHPHDSICGCSIDEVHEIDMKDRFFNAQMMGEESLKESLYQLSSMVKMDDLGGERIPFLVFNPLPWNRTETVKVKVLTPAEGGVGGPDVMEGVAVKDDQGKRCLHESARVELPPSKSLMEFAPYELRFIAENVPALGYKVYYLYPGDEPEEIELDKTLLCGENWIENKFYKLVFHPTGSFDITDKEAKKGYEKVGILEDRADWGDEYDYSGPKASQKDVIKYSDENSAAIEVITGPTAATANVILKMALPVGLTEDINRSTRESKTILNQIRMKITLPLSEKIIKISVDWENLAKDHRLRMLFPTGIVTETVEADGHFYIVPRTLTPPKDDTWEQKFVPTHHQHKFVTASTATQAFMVLNQGLPEYEAIKSKNGSITFAVTLLRSIGWLSRHDFATRGGNAGPPTLTPGAQCIGKQSCELAIITTDKPWVEAGLYWQAENYHAPLVPAVPQSIGTQYRMMDCISLVFGTYFKAVGYEKKPELNAECSLLKMTNPRLTLTACKKAENEDALIIRILNLTGSTQTDTIQFGLPVKNVSIVNYNEEVPKTPIKAKVSLKAPSVKLSIDANVLVSLKVTF